jgi:hypothetical protein
VGALEARPPPSSGARPIAGGPSRSDLFFCLSSSDQISHDDEISYSGSDLSSTSGKQSNQILTNLEEIVQRLDFTEINLISSKSTTSCKLLSNLKTSDQNKVVTNMICKLPEEEQSADQQSTENTRRDKPSALIPHDKDHADDP